VSAFVGGGEIARLKLWAILSAIALLLFVEPASAPAASNEPTKLSAANPGPTVSGFDAANRLYEQGNFGEAAEAYEALLRSGETSAALYFNLGNAYFKSAKIGRAVAAYRNAEQLTPRDPDIRANLQFARNQATGPSVLPSGWERWLGRLSLNEWTIAAAASVWLLLLLLTLPQWRPALKPVLRGYVLYAGILAVLTCACFALSLQQHRSARMAIVITGEAVVRGGPLETEANKVFTAHDGAELRVLDQKGDWLQVYAAPRQMGWVRRDQVVLTHS
jgi:tetratricopeptide (TPR) repeat protein